jgi:hypothetical protein
MCGQASILCCCGLEPTKEEKIEQLKKMKEFLDRKQKQVAEALAELEN